MRITQRAVALTSLQGLNRNLDAVGKLQTQLTSGRLINTVSDSPTGTNRAMQTRDEQAANAQQARNISDAQSWLDQSDSALQTMISTQVDAARESVAGVNLDEEMTNMLSYQHAYSAAGRLVTAIDETLDILINRTGLVGR